MLSDFAAVGPVAPRLESAATEHHDKRGASDYVEQEIQQISTTRRHRFVDPRFPPQLPRISKASANFANLYGSSREPPAAAPPEQKRAAVRRKSHQRAALGPGVIIGNSPDIDRVQVQWDDTGEVTHCLKTNLELVPSST
jgi:hypothetical protein